MTGNPSKPKYWYFIERNYCPLCGYEKEYRERVYGPKPENVYERIQTREIAYHCGY